MNRFPPVSAPKGHKIPRLLGALLMRLRPAPLAVAIKTMLGIRRLEIQTALGTFWIDPASEFGQRLLSSGVCEEATVSVLAKTLRIGGTFADVGANEGYFSVLAFRCVGPSGRIIAVEPQRRLRTVIDRNLALNGVGNATVAEVAVSDREGIQEINLSPSMNTGATSFLRRTRYSPKREAVRTATLKAILDEAKIQRVDLLKMDVEGWEYEAVLGSREAFQSGRIRAICIEIHDGHLRERGLNGGAIIDFLTECGYRQVAVGEALLFSLPDAVT